MKSTKSVGVELRYVPESLAAPTVMVVDEDLSLICRLGKILAAAGYQVIPALNSRQAASLIEKLRITPDLVIANPSLMKINGVNCKTPHEVAAEIKGFDKLRRPKTGLFGGATRERPGMLQGSASNGA